MILWLTGNPDHGINDCGYLYDSFEWADVWCGEVERYICEWNGKGHGHGKGQCHGKGQGQVKGHQGHSPFLIEIVDQFHGLNTTIFILCLRKHSRVTMIKA